MVIEGKTSNEKAYLPKEVTLTREIFVGITGISPLANPITRMFALQFRSFIESFVNFPPTGSYKTSTPLSFLSLRKALTFSMTFWWFKSTTWSTPKDLRYSTFLAPLKDNGRVDINICSQNSSVINIELYRILCSRGNGVGVFTVLYRTKPSKYSTRFGI